LKTNNDQVEYKKYDSDTWLDISLTCEFFLIKKSN